MSKNLCQTKPGLPKMARTMKQENGYNRWSCNSLEEPFVCSMPSQMVTTGASQRKSRNRIESDTVVGLVKGRKFLELSVSVENASNSEISSYPEKVLPINKRKSLYYVSQEDQDGNASLTNEVETPTSDTKRCGYAGNCSRVEYPAIKMRRLKSIYKETKPVTTFSIAKIKK